MRAIMRHLLAPVLIAAAFVAVGASAQVAAAPATHSRTSIADCPNGLNWDNITQTCQ